VSRNDSPFKAYNPASTSEFVECLGTLTREEFVRKVVGRSGAFWKAVPWQEKADPKAHEGVPVPLEASSGVRADMGRSGAAPLHRGEGVERVRMKGAHYDK